MDRTIFALLSIKSICSRAQSHRHARSVYDQSINNAYRVFLRFSTIGNVRLLQRMLVRSPLPSLLACIYSGQNSPIIPSILTLSPAFAVCDLAVQQAALRN